MRKKCALHVVITVLSSSDRPTGLVPDLLPPEISGEDACLRQRHLVAEAQQRQRLKALDRFAALCPLSNII
jgi:hypothetical protein